MSLAIIILSPPAPRAVAKVIVLYCFLSQSDRVNYDCDMISSCRRQNWIHFTGEFALFDFFDQQNYYVFTDSLLFTVRRRLTLKLWR